MAKIEIYTTLFCPFCAAAKRLLDQKGIAYDEVDVMLKPGLRAEMAERAGSRTVPQIFVDGRHVGDCEQLYALDSADRLDPLLESAT